MSDLHAKSECMKASKWGLKPRNFYFNKWKLLTSSLTEVKGQLLRKVGLEWRTRGSWSRDSTTFIEGTLCFCLCRGHYWADFPSKLNILLVWPACKIFKVLEYTEQIKYITWRYISKWQQRTLTFSFFQRKKIFFYKKELRIAVPHNVFVPGLVGGRAAQDVVHNVVDEEDDEEEGADDHPHDLPVPVGTVTNHVLNIFFKPETSK